MLTISLDSIAVHGGLSFRPVGAHVRDDGVTFRVWAPNHPMVRAVIGEEPDTRYITLEPESGVEVGFLSGRDEQGRPGDLYWFQLDHEILPDPASRFQPRGVDGPSAVIDPHCFEWRSNAWQRPPLRGRVFYELHIGAFTAEGTFQAAIGRLDELVELGVNTIELMPLGDFPGDRNWGYDGVMIHAPARCYGAPDDLRALIDAAHERGIAVVVDVVYNHLGPCGNVLPRYSDHYFHQGHGTMWGSGLNFDGPHSTPVRQFFLQNACMWFDEYRVDGLRLDAVHAIRDESCPHLITEIAAAAHARGAFVIAEDDRNDARIVTSVEEGGSGADGMWSDDFHHTMRVAVTGERNAHFANYAGALDEWVETLREGWFYRGQFFGSWKRERGTPAAHLPPEKFVVCISNHDQVGNRPLGDRLSALVAPEVYRAVSVLGCLMPYTPLLFMGQEWATRTPFPFFCDLPGDVGATMAENRKNEFKHNGANYGPDVLARMPDPQSEATFEAAKLNWSERRTAGHAQVWALYRECLRLRAAHSVFQSAPRSKWHVEKFDSAVAVRWHDAEADWLLLVSVAETGTLQPPDVDGRWEFVLSSNEERFGGGDLRKLTAPGAALWRARHAAA